MADGRRLQPPVFSLLARYGFVIYDSLLAGFGVFLSLTLKWSSLFGKGCSIINFSNLDCVATFRYQRFLRALSHPLFKYGGLSCLGIQASIYDPMSIGFGWWWRIYDSWELGVCFSFGSSILEVCMSFICDCSLDMVVDLVRLFASSSPATDVVEAMAVNWLWWNSEDFDLGAAR